jgi:hypothetical protein
VASDEIPPGDVVPDEPPGGAGSELEPREQDTVVLVSPCGSALVVAADERVNRLVAEAGRPGSAVPLSRLPGGRLSDVAAALGTVTGLLRTHGAYFELSADSLKKLQAGGQLMDAGGGWVRGVIRGGRGRFTDLAEFRRVGLAPTQALSVQLAATTLALMVATANVERAIQELGVDVATIRSIAEGKQLGDVAGLYRVLDQARGEADELGYVPESTWAAVAPHGVTAQQQADGARAIISRLVEGWPTETGVGGQEQVTRRVLKDGTLRSWLSVLAHSEANLLLWQSLKIDRVRVTEPELLADQVRRGESLARDNHDADQRLVERIAEAIQRMDAIETLDEPRWIELRRLRHNLTALHTELGAFAEARGLAVAEYVPELGALETAYRQVGLWKDTGIRRSKGRIRVSRRAIGKGLHRAGEVVAGEASRPAIEQTQQTEPPAIEPAEPPPELSEPAPSEDESQI